MRKTFKVLAIGMILVAAIVATAGAQVKTYKFGVMAPITGTNAEYGKGFKIATQMAVDEINAKGKIRIELVVKDSKGDPKETADIARQFADDASILAIVGDFSSSSCMAAAPIVDEAGLVMLSPTASNPNYASMSPFAYSVMGRQDGEAPFFATYLLKKYAKAKNIGLIWINSDWGKSAHDNLVSTAVKEGLTVVSDVSYLADEKDFSASIAKLRRGNPDHIIILDQGAVPTIINQIASSGWKNVQITTLGPGTSQQILNLCGANAEGLLVTTPFFFDPNSTKEMAWYDTFSKLAGFAPTVHPACAYDCVYLLEAAINSSGGKVTREGIRKSLDSNKSFSGLTGPIVFNPAGDVFRKYLIVKVENGKFIKKTDFDFAK